MLRLLLLIRLLLLHSIITNVLHYINYPHHPYFTKLETETYKHLGWHCSPGNVTSAFKRIAYFFLPGGLTGQHLVGEGRVEREVRTSVHA